MNSFLFPNLPSPEGRRKLQTAARSVSFPVINVVSLSLTPTLSYFLLIPHLFSRFVVILRVDMT